MRADGRWHLEGPLQERWQPVLLAAERTAGRKPLPWLSAWMVFRMQLEAVAGLYTGMLYCWICLKNSTVSYVEKDWQKQWRRGDELVLEMWLVRSGCGLTDW